VSAHRRFPPSRWEWLLLSSLLVAAMISPGFAAPIDDAYIRGYASAVLERDLGIVGALVEATDGVVTVSAEWSLARDRDKIITALSKVRGVVRVDVVERVEQRGVLAPAAPASADPTAAPAGGAPPAVGGANERRLGTGWLPAGLLFDPLHADPRWPNFSAGYQRYTHDRDFSDVAAVSFGEAIPLYRGELGPWGQWEAGLQAGVFSIFDLDASSFDLINADYFVAVPLSYRRGPFSAIARVFHQSSHLGDEFLLRTNAQRINLSYEGVDTKLSYDFFDRALRVYAGAGYLFDRDPSSLKPWSTQAGFELQSPWTLLGGLARPVFAADFQTHEENGWSTDVSLRGGLQLESFQVVGRKLQWMLEYFNGHSPNGQFFKDQIQYFGVAAHLYY
jgi:Protein of unknown function (DUF1207)